MRKLVVFFSLMLQSISWGQNILPIAYDTNLRSQEFILIGGIDLSTTGIKNSLTRYFIRGGEIPEDVRQSSFDNHSSRNRVGAVVQPEFTYINYNVKPFKSKKWGIQVKAGMNVVASGRYTKGLFGLAFLGNDQFLGTTVDLSNSNFSLYGGHKLGFGIIDAKTKSSVTLSIHGITSYSNGHLDSANFYQSADGYDALINLSGSFETTSRSTFYKGLGVGVDADIILPIEMAGKTSFLQFQIQNLGIGFLTDDRITYSMDTSIHYSGFQISDLIGDNALLKEDKDVLDAIGLHRDTVASKPIALPFSVQVGKIVDEHKTQLLQAFFGARAIYQKGAIPLIYAGMQIRATDYLRFGMSGAYGGFAKFRIGIYCNAVFPKFNLGISTTNLIGLVSKSGLGQAYSLHLNYRL